ncbi:hypothetical protein AURDEDRAFT_179730 [Auricularia subglabra TFB-10046 SS5]|nr:hypothetical protein AURDEDRAFT_179730 [Auricularia subglabra TFB-10046 SS5]
MSDNDNDNRSDDGGMSSHVVAAVDILKDTSIAVDSAATQIAAKCAAQVEDATREKKPTSVAGDTPGLGDFLWSFWTDFLVAVQEDGELHERAIDIMMQLRKQTAPSDWLVWGEGMNWDELTLFGPVARDELDGPARNDPALLHAFYAKLAARWDACDLTYGLWAMRDALEYAPDSKHFTDEEVSRAEAIECAAQWALYAAPLLLASREILGPNGNPDWPSNAGKPGRGGDLWKGVDGFHPDRWALWKAGFAQAALEESLAGDARTAAKAAAEAMARAEAGADTH